MGKATLKIFVLRKQFRHEMAQAVTSKILNLLKDYSFEIFEQRKATVGHTFFDAIRNTLLKEALNTPLCKFLTVNSQTGETKQFFSRPAKHRKEHLIQWYKTRMQDIHLTMCKTDEYLSLLTDKSGQIVYDSTLYLKGFDRRTDRVRIEFIESLSHIFHRTHYCFSN